MMRRLLVLAALCAGRALTAQATDGGFAPWHSVQVESGRSGVPVLLRGSEVTAVLIPVGAHERAVRESNLRANASLCAGALGLSGEQIAMVAARRAWRALDSAAHNRPLVAVSVVATPRDAAPCGLDGEPRAADAASGTIFATTATLPPRVARVEIVADGVVQTPSREGAAEVLLVTAQGTSEHSDWQRRVLLAPEAFAPRADGTTPRIEIHVWLGDAAAASVIAVSPDAVRAMWDSVMPWRAARLAGVAAPQTLPVRLPLVQDRVLLRSRQLFREGNHAVASSEAWARLHEASRIPATERLSMFVQLGLSWSAHGDMPAARAAFAGVMRIDPCIVLPESVFAAARRAMEDVRPTNACVPRTASEELRRGLVPGGAQRLAPGGRAKAGRVIFTAVVTQAATAVLSGVIAHRLYAQYETETRDPSGVWKRAEIMRGVANVAIAGAVLTWSGAAIEGGYWADRWNRGLDERREYGARATRAFGQVDAPGAVR